MPLSIYISSIYQPTLLNTTHLVKFITVKTPFAKTLFYRHSLPITVSNIHISAAMSKQLLNMATLNQLLPFIIHQETLPYTMGRPSLYQGKAFFISKEALPYTKGTSSSYQGKHFLIPKEDLPYTKGRPSLYIVLLFFLIVFTFFLFVFVELLLKKAAKKKEKGLRNAVEA